MIRGKTQRQAGRPLVISKQLKYIAVGILAACIFFILNKKYFFLILFTFCAAYAKYFRVQIRLPISLEPVFFFSILLTRVFGLKYGIILILFCCIAVDLVMGDLSSGTIISLAVLTILNIAAIVFAGQPIVIFGLIVSCINLILSFLLSLALNVPPDRLILMPITNFFFNISYFITFAEILEKLMLF